MKKLLTLTIGIVAFLVIAWATNPWWTHGTSEVVVTDVQSKLMDRHGNREDVYLVFTTDGTYRNTDTLYYMKFNSSDIQGKLAQKGRFRISYYGFRVPPLSVYRNITKAEKVE